jgi:hypothetical protein
LLSSLEPIVVGRIFTRRVADPTAGSKRKATIFG